MLASAAIKNALVGFPMTLASTLQAYCKYNHQSHIYECNSVEQTHCMIPVRYSEGLLFQTYTTLTLTPNRILTK